ncbi:hypothetical protein J4447_03695 [Candidatus Pacearchaeota archaeon]|nr:hypothetical protein [Candidatus Pacearchaeota archaeon]
MVKVRGFLDIREEYFERKEEGEAQLTYFLCGLASEDPESLLRLHEIVTSHPDLPQSLDLRPGIHYVNAMKDDKTCNNAVYFVAQDLARLGFDRPLNDLEKLGITQPVGKGIEIRVIGDIRGLSTQQSIQIISDFGNQRELAGIPGKRDLRREEKERRESLAAMFFADKPYCIERSFFNGEEWLDHIVSALES